MLTTGTQSNKIFINNYSFKLTYNAKINSPKSLVITSLTLSTTITASRKVILLSFSQSTRIQLVYIKSTFHNSIFFQLTLFQLINQLSTFFSQSTYLMSVYFQPGFFQLVCFPSVSLFIFSKFTLSLVLLVSLLSFSQSTYL